MSRYRRALVVTTALVLSTVVATPARAAEPDPFVPSAEVTRGDWGYVDAHKPRTGYLNPAGEAPVGDGKRSYFMFDVAPLKGKHVIGAKLTARQMPADCAKHAVELWRTEPFTAKSSWNNKPKDLKKLADVECAENLTLDLTGVLTEAAAKGEDKVTLGLRVPTKHEWDKRYARKYGNDLKLQVVFNTPPLPPTRVWAGHWDNTCKTEAPGSYFRIPYTDLGASIPDDPDGRQDELLGRLAVWPVDNPQARQERATNFYNNSISFSLYYSGIPVEDKKTYGFTFQADDRTDRSPESPTCYFTMDTVAPDKEPVVTSEQYPEDNKEHGDVGAPGTFTFSANGVDDIVGFYWGQYGNPNNYVAADRPGGSASITFTPTNSGGQSLTVYSVDKAGSSSPYNAHHFIVRESRPLVRSDVYPDYYAGGGIGVPGEFVFTPNLPNTVEHLYSFNGEPERSIAGNSVTYTPSRGGEHTLTVRGKDSAGNLGAKRVYVFRVNTAPQVLFNGEALIGRPSTVSLTPGMPGVVEYEYWWNDDEERKTVAAGADGKAQIEWVPSMSLWNFELHARSKTASGEYSDIGESRSTWNDLAAPTATLVIGGKRPGDPAVIDVSTRMPNPTEYSWEIGNERGKVAAGPDGKATIRWTPKDDGYHSLYVRATNATGAVTDGTSVSITTYSSPRVTSTDYPEYRWAGGVGVPGKFTFTPYETTPDVVAYVYVYDNGWEEGPEQTVEAGPDRSATVTITPTEAGYNYVKVRAKSADGTLSGRRTYTIQVNYPEN